MNHYDVHVWREGSNVVVVQDGVKHYFERERWEHEAKRYGDPMWNQIQERLDEGENA